MSIHSSLHGADSLIGENFQQQTVRQTPIDEVNALHSCSQGFDRAVHLGPHALGDHAALLQGANFAHPQGGNETVRVFRIKQQARNVGEVDEATRLQSDRHLGCSSVRVGVVDLSVLGRTQTGNHRYAPSVQGSVDEIGRHTNDLAHETEIVPVRHGYAMQGGGA